jgi:hypothetical protein
LLEFSALTHDLRTYISEAREPVHA